MTLAQMLRWPQLLLGYWTFLRRFRPNKIIHTNWHSLLMIWPFLKPERDVYWVHEVFFNKRQYRCLFSALAKRLGSFVVVSDAVKESLVTLGVPSNRIRVIYNGIADPASELGGVNPEANSTIGIVGQVGAWKGHEDLLQALRTVVQSFPTAELHVFGGGSAAYEEFLRARVVGAGIEKNVKWKGFVSDRARIYPTLSVLAVPSRSADPLPTSAIEAGFFGVPVVASRCGGLPEIVEDGVTGLLFESGNIDELAEHLTRLLAEPDLRRKMGGSARKRAMCLFGRGRFVREFCEILELK
jgi:glycosyltransferase involved in cell wall biosynthesis